MRSRADLPIVLITLAAALSSIAALLLQWAHVLRMPYTVSFLTLPGLVGLGGIAVWAGRADRRLPWSTMHA